MSRSTDTDPPLTVKAVFDVIVKAKDPSILGLHLLENKYEVTICMNDNPFNHRGLAHAIAKSWIERSTKQPTWEKLIESLEKVYENTLAQEVRENCVLQRGSTTSTGSSGFCSSFSSSEPTSPGIRNMPTGECNVLIWLHIKFIAWCIHNKVGRVIWDTRYNNIARRQSKEPIKYTLHYL